MINKSGESKGAADEVFQEILSDTIIREGEINKGIPWISFVYRERDEAVLIHPLSLFCADERIKRTSLAGKEILYRADYLEKGRRRIASGILPAGKEAAGYLGRLEKGILSGEKKAGSREFYLFLKIHFVLCKLEIHGEERKALAERMDRAGIGSRETWKLERLYCEELFSYVEEVRENLNYRPEKIVLPAFPTFGGVVEKQNKGIYGSC